MGGSFWQDHEQDPRTRCSSLGGLKQRCRNSESFQALYGRFLQPAGCDDDEKPPARRQDYGRGGTRSPSFEVCFGRRGRGSRSRCGTKEMRAAVSAGENARSRFAGQARGHNPKLDFQRAAGEEPNQKWIRCCWIEQQGGEDSNQCWIEWGQRKEPKLDCSRQRVRGRAAVVAVLLAVKIVNESRASRCPSWWQPAGCDDDEKPPARRQDYEQGARCPC